MEIYTIKDLTFTYPGRAKEALTSVNVSINIGQMVTICGCSGSGKSTLLRCLKPILTPHGSMSGEILFETIPVRELDGRVQAERIGYVLQNPDAQIVTDKVWHELAFGLESLGMDTKTIRLRVAEMASFFGIQNWFNKDVHELSGGQKQMLNLAAVMVMQPDVLILDEPTSQLDPIAASDFLETVRKINRELGTTVIMTEHRLEEVIPMSDRVVVLDNGRVIVDDGPDNVGKVLAKLNHPMFMAMPTPIQVYSMVGKYNIDRQLQCPVDVRDGRTWLTELFRNRSIVVHELPLPEESAWDTTPVIEMKDVWFKYDKNDEDVIKDLNMKVYCGEIYCILGGNGTGKTTTLCLAGGIRKPYRGTIRIKGRKTKEYSRGQLTGSIIGILPQDPQSLLVEKTVRLDLMDMLTDVSCSYEDKISKVAYVAEVAEIEELLDMHPYDLSGGEQQRAALAKVLLMEPEILLLDEPTKGLDNNFKRKMAGILMELKSRGITIVIVSHDVEFCGRYADRCAMFFDGKIITTNEPRRFFSGNSFYTTAANRMSRHIFGNVVNVDDVVDIVKQNIRETGEGDSGNEGDSGGSRANMGNDRLNGSVASKILTSTIDEAHSNTKASVAEVRSTGLYNIIIAIAALAACSASMLFLDDKKYLVISMIIIAYSMITFVVSFEHRRPEAREVVLLAVMVATAVVGRAAFFMIPSFKPVLAIVIIAGAGLGRQSGFLVGTMAAFVSNFLFGQGPWTPWQMIAMAITGYLAGLIFDSRIGNIRRIAIAIYGGLAALLIYGPIVDIWTIMNMSSQINFTTIVAVYTAAIPFNMVHATATVIFLLILANPMIEKLDRVRIKYGMRVGADKRSRVLKPGSTID